MSEESKVEFSGPTATLFGSYYPRGYVVAVLDDPARAEAAVAELRAAGFPEREARVWSGQAVMDQHGAYVEQHRIRYRIGDLFPSEEKEALGEYLAHAERGGSFVTVHAEEGDQQRRAADVLHAHGATGVRFYGAHTISDL